MAMTDMKAVRAHHRGGPEQLVYEVATRPEPRPGEALVRVRAASITRDELTWDESWADGPGPDARDRTPVIPSHELSGVVSELGAGTAQVAVDDEVYGLIPFNTNGAAAEFVTVPAAVLAAKPATIDHDAAAAIPLAALTAWQALVDHASLREGQHVLVHGAAGGVGVFAVQLAAHLGATVTATARGSDQDFLRGLGATDVLDHRHQVFEDHVEDVDVVLDLVGGETQARSWQVLRPGGTLVSIVAPPQQEQGDEGGKRGIFFIVKPDRAQLESIAQLVDSGDLTPVVDRVMPLVDTRAAYEELEKGHRRGKIVLHVAD
jgi:NADPH:quinone reductase-like Zn-dependent oxidoreductase